MSRTLVEPSPAMLVVNRHHDRHDRKSTLQHGCRPRILSNL